MNPLARCLLWLLPLSVAACAAGVAIGSVTIAPAALLEVLLGGGEPLERTLLLELRLPRALSAFAVGGLLAVAGALMQVLLRNPLADPYVLGLSGGAATGALLAMLAGLGTTLVSGAAFAGALVSTVIVFGTAHGTGSWTPTRLLLTGVVVAATIVLVTGWTWADSLVAVGIGLFIVPRAFRLAHKAIRILTQSVPVGLDPVAVHTELAAISGVVDVHDLHVWTLTSGMDVATAHLVVGEGTTTHPVLDRARDLMKDVFGITHTTFQLEPDNHRGCDEIDW